MKSIAYLFASSLVGLGLMMAGNNAIDACPCGRGASSDIVSVETDGVALFKRHNGIDHGNGNNNNNRNGGGNNNRNGNGNNNRNVGGNQQGRNNQGNDGNRDNHANHNHGNNNDNGNGNGNNNNNRNGGGNQQGRNNQGNDGNRDNHANHNHGNNNDNGNGNGNNNNNRNGGGNQQGGNNGNGNGNEDQGGSSSGGRAGRTAVTFFDDRLGVTGIDMVKYDKADVTFQGRKVYPAAVHQNQASESLYNIYEVDGEGLNKILVQIVDMCDKKDGSCKNVKSFNFNRLFDIHESATKALGKNDGILKGKYRKVGRIGPDQLPKRVWSQKVQSGSSYVLCTCSDKCDKGDQVWKMLGQCN